MQSMPAAVPVLVSAELSSPLIRQLSTAASVTKIRRLLLPVRISEVTGVWMVKVLSFPLTVSDVLFGLNMTVLLPSPVIVCWVSFWSVETVLLVSVTVSLLELPPPHADRIRAKGSKKCFIQVIPF